jgi:ParB-like chromosome segregation protein Spo0J
MSEKNLPSLKAMAESKVDGIQTMKMFSVDPALVEVEDGFNRPLNREHIESIKITIKAGGILDPIWVRVDNGAIILVDGEHRLTAVLECIGEGLSIPPNGYKMPAQQFRGNDAERVAHLLTSSQGLPLTPLQRGIQYRKLEAFGWSHHEIANKVGRTTTHVAEMILLAGSNSDVQVMVASGEVSAANAAKVVRKHGEGAGKVLDSHMQAARMNGKKKITEKSISGATPKNLPEAIKWEMESGGAIRAHDICPKYADLINYLRGTSLGNM